MTSADFSRQILFQPGILLRFHPSVRPPRVRAQSFLPSICHIYIASFRIVSGFSLYGNLTQLAVPYVIPVRQTRSLPPASFRFLVTEDTLALGYVLGTINPH